MLAAFSGIDGQTDTLSRMVGWYTEPAYSIYLWLPRARTLELGFFTEGCTENCAVSADPAQDKGVSATNDALVVERGDSRLAVTWKDRHTIVGFVEGALASVTLRGTNLSNTTVSISSTEVLAFTTHTADAKFGVTQFALCYVSTKRVLAKERAVACAASRQPRWMRRRSSPSVTSTSRVRWRRCRTPTTIGFSGSSCR